MSKWRGKKGGMAIKVDLEKAYDRLRWSFIHQTLRLVGFPVGLIELIMNCVQASAMQVLWNGEKTTPFKPTRGIRQGDPLSSY